METHYSHSNQTDRFAIQLLLQAGCSRRQTADKFGFSPSTVRREVIRGKASPSPCRPAIARLQLNRRAMDAGPVQALGLQVKSGAGNFTATDNGPIYRGSLKHLDYWLAHALPVVLVAHLPETDETFWVQIPKASRLDLDAQRHLLAIFGGTPRQQRLRRLTLDEGLMRHIAANGKVSVELGAWYNKSLNRSPITVFVEDGNGDVTVEVEWFGMFSRIT